MSHGDVMRSQSSQWLHLEARVLDFSCSVGWMGEEVPGLSWFPGQGRKPSVKISRTCQKEIASGPGAGRHQLRSHSRQKLSYPLGSLTFEPAVSRMSRACDQLQNLALKPRSAKTGHRAG